ncbi:peroxidase-like [Epargyreus clarus]|uniref:peroxidase-like n=1 Tax=Epargyreus clarus TaxID=520877 RepID=UPI003C3093F3
MEGDREVPAGQSPFCFKNQAQNLEVSCYDFGNNYDSNLLQGIYMTTMWFFREHNRLARQLALINPCWDDQQLYDTARKINIAQWQFIFYYELIPEILGKLRLVTSYMNAFAAGIIFDTKGHVNDFNPNCEPGVYHEYILGSRFFHSLQPNYAE